MVLYVCVFIGAMAVSLLATPLAARIAKARGLVDEPGVRKVHKTAVPRVGGAAVFFAALVATMTAVAWDALFGNTFRGIHVQMAVLLCASCFVFLIGLLDDLRSMPAKIKFLALVAASLAVCFSGARIQRIEVGGLFSLQLGWASWPATVLWIVLLTVGMNFIDGLDGLAAGIAVIVCGTIATLAFFNGQPATATMMLAVVGSLVGFLFFNFNPARIFMGDCGSMFLGFIIGAGSIVCSSKTSAIVGLGLPMLAMGVPILDTALTIIRRGIIDRRSIFSAERGHIHHRLMDMGFRHRQVVLLIHGITLVAAAIGMVTLGIDNFGSLLIIALGLALLLVLFHSVGHMRVAETLAAAKRNLNIKRLAKVDSGKFEYAQLAMREARTFEEWWNVICNLAETMEFERLNLSLSDHQGHLRRWTWRRAPILMLSREAVGVTIPLRGFAGGFSSIEGAMTVSGTYETAGRRLMLLGRLIDEQEAGTALKFARVLAEPATQTLPSVRRRQFQGRFALPAA